MSASSIAVALDARRAARLAAVICAAVGVAHAQSGGSSTSAPDPNTGGPANAQTRAIEPYIRIQQTYSNNGAAIGGGNANHRNEWATDISGGARIRWVAKQAQLSGVVGAQGNYFLYGANDRTTPNVNLSGKLQVIDRLFFVDGSVASLRQYLSPFGSQPETQTASTANRYTQSVVRVAPTLQGVIPGTPYSFTLRDEISKIETSGGFGNFGNSSQNTLTGRFAHAPRPLGWELSYTDSESKFPGREPYVTQILRARPQWQIDPQLLVSVMGGYEYTRGVALDKSGSVYGAGVNWRPTPRTNIATNWERRFFGPAHTVSFDHRWPGFAITASSSRDITSFPQLIARFPVAGNVEALLDAQYTTRIPDPVERQRAVDTVIRTYNLPTQLAGALDFFSNDLLLRSAQNLTFTLHGVRNTLAATFFQSRTDALTGAANALPPELGLIANSRQRGLSLLLSHRMTGTSDLSILASNTRASALATLGETRQQVVRVTVDQRLAARTTGFVGARYQRFDSDLAAFRGFTEVGGFVGLDHRF